MSILAAPMNFIDLSMDVIDLTQELIDLSEEGVGDLLDLIEQNAPQHADLNGYISDDGFVVDPDAPIEYEEESEMGDDEEEEDDNGHVHSDCIICLDPVTEEDEGGNVTILMCGHTFHNVCLTNWILVKDSCPTCSGSIEGAHTI